MYQLLVYTVLDRLLNIVQITLELINKALKSIVKAQLMERDAIYVQSLAYCC